jgi:hypothetical protein
MNSATLRKQRLIEQNDLLRQDLDDQLEVVRPVAGWIEQGYAIAQVVRENSGLLSCLGIGPKRSWLSGLREFLG